MTYSSTVPTDSEDALRTYLRDAGVGMAAARVFFGLPERYDLTSGPAVAIQVIATTPASDSDAGVEDVLWQLDVWASTKAVATAVRVALLNLLYAIDHVTVPGKAVLIAAHDVTWRFQPDPTDPQTARYVVEATITTG